MEKNATQILVEKREEGELFNIKISVHAYTILYFIASVVPKRDYLDKL